MKLSLILAGLLVTSTAGARTVRIPTYIDREFSNEDDFAIVDAMIAWNKRLHGYVIFDLVRMDEEFSASDRENTVYTGPLLIMKVGPEALATRTNPNDIAWAQLGGRKAWFLRDAIADSAFELTVEHELGHILGASHRLETKNIMWPFAQAGAQIPCVTFASAEEIAAAQKIPFIGWTCGK